MSRLPSWEEFNAVVLRALDAGTVLTVRNLRNAVIELAGLSKEQQLIALTSGDSMAENRIGWSISYLNRVGAIERPCRGKYHITPVGRDLLRTRPNGITEKDLRQLAKPDDQWWMTKKPTGTLKDMSDGSDEDQASDTTLDPTEQIEKGVARVNDEVASSLLGRLQNEEPAFFERTVMALLIAMGYGGAHGQGSVTKITNDGGIDGVIDQDALGLNKIYIQAKRYSTNNSVQRPEVQSFVGALSGKADGGLFITTSKFTKGSIDYVHNVPARIILVDGQQLAKLMIQYGVGVETKRTYQVVAVDEDFFA